MNSTQVQHKNLRLTVLKWSNTKLKIAFETKRERNEWKEWVKEMTSIGFNSTASGFQGYDADHYKAAVLGNYKLKLHKVSQNWAAVWQCLE